MIEIVNILWLLIQFTIGIHLVYPMILFLLSRSKQRKSYSKSRGVTLPDYAIIVTAYEQTHMLPQVIDSILKLNYVQYHVYIVADNCDVSTLDFMDPRVSILCPDQVLASNTKSHFYAIQNFVRDHDILTIIDSDNLVHQEYINELNAFFNRGYHAVQGVRAPKNLNTTLACLDAARDIYYNYYDGHLLFKLGSSATLAGSGMAFTVDLYKECLDDWQIQGAGFDKVLQTEIVKSGFIIAHAPKALVYDEKTSHSDQLVNQRSRWINTWFKYFRFGGKLVVKGIGNFNRNQFLFGITLLRPPLFIFILLSFVCMVINLFVNPLFALYWMIGFVLFCLSFMIALQKGEASDKIRKSLISIPKFIYLQVISLYYSKRANERSVVTKHT